MTSYCTISGVMKTHEALQEHTHVLEATLAQRESSVVEMSSHVQEELVRKERRCTDLAAQVEKLQTAVQEEKNSAKESKKLVSGRVPCRAVITWSIISQFLTIDGTQRALYEVSCEFKPLSLQCLA